MFGRKRIKELEKEVRELSANALHEQNRRLAAEQDQAKAKKWAEQLKKDADAIAKERDELKKMVREQTENDIAIAALKTLGIISGEKPTKGESAALMAQNQRVTMMNAQLSSNSSFGLGSSGHYGRYQQLLGAVPSMSGWLGGL